MTTKTQTVYTLDEAEIIQAIKEWMMVNVGTHDIEGNFKSSMIEFNSIYNGDHKPCDLSASITIDNPETT